MPRAQGRSLTRYIRSRVRETRAPDSRQNLDFQSRASRVGCTILCILSFTPACYSECRYLYQRQPSGFMRSGTYSMARDAGMCTAWAPSGHVFAAASQDGLVCIWDVRSPQVWLGALETVGL